MEFSGDSGCVKKHSNKPGPSPSTPNWALFVYGQGYLVGEQGRQIKATSFFSD